MTGDDHFRKLERMYLSAPINEYYKPVLSISDGQSQLVIPVRPCFFHVAGAVHGSVYFKALHHRSHARCRLRLRMSTPCPRSRRVSGQEAKTAETADSIRYRGPAHSRRRLRPR